MAITVAQAAEILGRSSVLVRRLLSEGRIRGEKVGRDWITTEEAVAEYEKATGETRTLRERAVALEKTVKPETFEVVKGLAEEMGCSEGEVIESAVRVYGTLMRDGKNGSPTAVGILGLEVEAPEMRARAVMAAAADTSSMVASETERAKDGHCVHCGEDFDLIPGAPPTSICLRCVAGGHKPGQICMKCAEREHYAKKAAESTSSEPESIDFTVDWGA